MASSDLTPLWWRRDDPDETAGRVLYRQIADAEARMQMSLTRAVRFAPRPEQEESKDG